MKKTYLLLIIPVIFLSLLVASCQPKKIYNDQRVVMGTFLDTSSPYEQASAIAYNEIKRIESLLSKYDPKSEVSQLNKNGILKAGPETFFVIAKAKEFTKLTNGVFDITIGPLMDVWGFTDKNYKVPSQKNIDEIMKKVGADKIVLSSSDNVIKFTVPGIKIDLGGIAKGYALDCAVLKLRKAGIKSCLLNLGGQIYCLGSKLGQPWRIAVKDPRNARFNGLLELKDQSVATSGDYEQYFTADNIRYTHIMNPLTGFPVKSGVISATVLASSGILADILSTTVFILGKEKGIKFAESFPKVQAWVEETKK